MNERMIFIGDTGYWYEIIGEPQPDNDELTTRGPRLMFHHGSLCRPLSTVFIAPRDILTAGWVLGVVTEAFDKSTGRSVDI